VKNQPPQPMSGSARGKTAATKQPSPTKPTAEQPAQVAAEQPTTSPASSSTTSPASSSTTSPAENDQPAVKTMPTMAIFFFHPHCYEMFNRAAELAGQSLHDWVQDSIYDVAEAAINFDDRQAEELSDKEDQIFLSERE